MPSRGAEMYGLFGTAWALMQFIFSPVQGSLSDHFGRRSVILISCAGLGLDFMLMALAPNLWWLLARPGDLGNLPRRASAPPAPISRT